MRRRTATRGATRSATSRDACRCGADAAGARPRASWPLGGSASPGDADGGRRADGRGVAREGLRHRPLGDDGRSCSIARSRVSARAFRRDHRRLRAPDGSRRARQQGRVRHRRSSTSLAPSTCAPARSIVYTSADSVFQIAAHEDVVPVPELYRACEIAYTLVGEGLGVGRVIARPFVGEPGSFRADRESPRLRAAAAGRDAARPPEGRRRCRWSRLARSRTCSPAAASPRAHHTASDDEGMDAVERQMTRRGSRTDLRQPRRLRYAVRAPQRRGGLRAQSRALRRQAGRACCRGSATTIC